MVLYLHFFSLLLSHHSVGSILFSTVRLEGFMITTFSLSFLLLSVMTIKKARTTERSYELISHPRTTGIPHLFNQIIKGTVYSYASVNSFLASEFTYFLLEIFFVLRLLAQDLLTYSMCLTK